MPRIIVQIYEIQTPAEAEQMAALGVDHIGGVILSARAWRDVRLRDTVAAIGRTPARSCLIPLFSESERVLRALDWYRPDIVHFCEALTEADPAAPATAAGLALQAMVRRHFPDMRIMRSIPIGPPGGAAAVPTLALARLFEPCSDYFLTDTLLAADGAGVEASQPVDGFVGITGRVCDWDTAADLVAASRLPVILAGGMAPGNVAEGLRRVRPAGVDSCTGTNAADPRGRALRFAKDPQKVARLVAAARQFERELAGRTSGVTTDNLSAIKGDRHV